MNTLFNMKKAAIACLVVLGAGSVQVSASEREPGKCSLDFALTYILHAATPEFVESMRQRSGATVVRVERGPARATRRSTTQIGYASSSTKTTLFKVIGAVKGDV